MSAQPKALQLADALERGPLYLDQMPSAAAELRRLSAVEQERDRLLSALLLAQRMCLEALPKFNWGASCLDANAIKLLNDAPLSIDAAITKSTEAA